MRALITQTALAVIPTQMAIIALGAQKATPLLPTQTALAGIALGVQATLHDSQNEQHKPLKIILMLMSQLFSGSDNIFC
jgi:hypothetical protein